ncbi:MAG: sulfite oxidase [Candidatus Methylomirabilaceae bacterium]
MTDVALHAAEEQAALELRQAREAGLVVLGERPLNCETPLPAQVGIITPTARFYIRSHFDVPRLDPATWRLAVGGLVERPLSLSLPALRRLPSRSLIVTLECAGNGRSLMEPAVEGEQWQLGAVSTAEWTGVPLVEVLNHAGVKRTAQEVVFRGADRGTPRGRTNSIRFERSLTLDWARHPDVLLAFAMNGEPLRPDHGSPLRLVVPGWYGMASVKWLNEVEVVDRPFTGHFQVTSYVFERERDGLVVKEPVTRERVRSLIIEPARDETVVRGELVVRGLAWSGQAPVTRVEVSVGGAWEEARLLDQSLTYAWRRWELMTQVETTGDLELRARARDASGQTQPDRPEWNRLGYCNNAIQLLPIAVTGDERAARSTEPG